MNRMFKRYLYFFLGVIINSFGVAFITKSALGTSQISSVPYALSHPIQFLQVGANIIFSLVIDLGTAKICFDVTLIVVAGLLSFIFFGRLNGVGLGTVISALAVGKIVNVLNCHLKFFKKIPR